MEVGVIPAGRKRQGTLVESLDVFLVGRLKFGCDSHDEIAYSGNLVKRN